MSPPSLLRSLLLSSPLALARFLYNESPYFFALRPTHYAGYQISPGQYIVDTILLLRTGLKH